MKTQTERFVDDRVGETNHFLNELRNDYRSKCSPADWQRILMRVLASPRAAAQDGAPP